MARIHFILADINGMPIAQEKNANANLIAAAPEMLEELEEILPIREANCIEPKHQASISAVTAQS